MSFFSRLFGQRKPTIQCPRCLGKGHVDMDDIKRLNKELRWEPGTCAYCNGKGKVDPGMIDQVAVDTSYLTSDLPKEERQRIIDNDSEAHARGRMIDAQVNNAIHEIIYLYFICELDTDKIADFFLLTGANELRRNGTYEKEKVELMDYVNRVIASKKNSNLN